MTTGLVERETEVGVLEWALTGLAAGRGGVVVVDAAPGLGKTVLLRHARDLALAAGLRVLSARGAELERVAARDRVRWHATRSVRNLRTPRSTGIRSCRRA